MASQSGIIKENGKRHVIKVGGEGRSQKVLLLVARRTLALILNEAIRGFK